MRVCMRRRSWTLRAWLVIFLLTLHLLLVLLVLSMYHAPCESHSKPDTQASISISMHNSSTSASKAVTAGSDITEEEIRDAADLAKLDALFSHPMYNLPTPPVPDGDRLLKVRTKTKEEVQHSTQQW